jgi:glycosyltransferase involved in cell wall biosynthesis
MAARQMRIAILATEYSPGSRSTGKEAFLGSLVDRLMERGHEVVVYELRRSDDATPDADHVIPIAVPDLPIVSSLAFARRFARRSDEPPPDVVLVTHPPMARRLRRHPYVVRVPTSSLGEAAAMRRHTPRLFAEWLLRRFAIPVLERSVFADADWIVANHDHVARILMERYGRSPERMSTIVNGVDTAKFTPSPEGPGDGPEGDPIIAYAGRLVSRKNVAALIDAQALLRDRGVACRLHIAGSGPLERALRTRAARSNREGDVVFVGRLSDEDLPAFLRRAAVFCLPSRLEGMPNAVLEAQACGLPTVVAPFAGAEDVVVDGHTGYVAADHSAASLADSLERILCDDALRREMAGKARERMRREFDWGLIADAYEALFEKLISEQRG